MSSTTRSIVFNRAAAVGVVCVLTAAGVAQESAPPTGLNALSDDRVLNELARRNLTALLDYAFEKNNVPKEKRDAIAASSALARLRGGKPLPLTEQRKLVGEYVTALPQLLPAMTDPSSIIGDATKLIESGITVDQRLLEYFGPNASIMARLKPTAAGVQQMLARAKLLAEEAATRASENWPAGRPAWEKADQMATNAEYVRNLMTYANALATDKADPKRAESLKEAVEYLSSFDVDENPNRAFVRFYLAQLQMAEGTPESLAKARANFKSVIEAGDKSNLGQQFEARFLDAVAAVEAKDPASAQAAAETMTTWAKQSPLAKDNANDIATAIAALDYRIKSLQSETAKDAAEAKTFADAADGVLNKLQQDQPSLRPLILQLMSARVKPDTPVVELNNLLLQSLLIGAETETVKAKDVPFDKGMVKRGIDAAKELLKPDRQTEPAVAASAEYDIPFFYQKLDQPVEAATAFLDYVDKYKNADADEPKRRVEVAFNSAIVLVGGLFSEKMGDPAVTALYDRVLETAVEKPFERYQFAFERARRLQANGKLAEAVEMFDKVPADTKQASDAVYFKSVAVYGLLQKLKIDDPKRAGMLDQLQKLADKVTTTARDQLKETPAANAKVRNVLLTRLAQTQLLAADLALRDQKDPKRALELLDKYEETVKGLPGENELLGEALLIRVQGYVQTGEVSRATDELVQLAERRPEQAGQIVYNLLEKLNTQVADAKALSDNDRMRELQKNRAALTPFYVKWIETNPNEELRKQLYNARIFDADTQRQAADLAEDPAEKKKLYKDAFEKFKALGEDKNFKEFLELQPPDRRKKLRYDPQVKQGLARTSFGLEDYKEARANAALLFRDKVIGTGLITTVDPAGTIESRENPTYWEMAYVLMKSNVKLEENVDGMKRFLREQAVLFSGSVGGKTWATEYQQLAKELDVDLNVKSPTTSPALDSAPISEPPSPDGSEK